MSAIPIREILRRRDTTRDPLHIHPVNDIAHKIQAIVADAEEVTAILDGLTHQRTAGTLKKPGAYFCASLKRAFARNQIPW
jgi:hypothetical protein